MSLTLHTLHSASGSHSKSKRVGRGNASGKGSYSGRGMKGQRSRAGGKSGLKRRALKDQFLSKIPKLRGFRSLQPHFDIINVGDLNQLFEKGAVVDRVALIQKGIVKKSSLGVKCLGRGALSKSLTVKLEKVSETARKSIEQAGGTIELVVHEKVRNVLPKAERQKKKA
ncbi:MAG: 50S ribosomal protein L15 [Candidatus Jacksonbacteria bacterium RIFCSPLOWO2_02_FULL_43_9]|nr:MAG: 50S ribosomal protein L15 [Parcubacteria group bacterium GW2011_GWA2_43_13]OGY69173.1 MAG: 50S ribosomal protein L15 [Candidatus Jacksonbacteria bacterium RIFCSPHIGHO2_02_FULL_43_10]OGY70488.1 MAG: 50S ribosomal protein L15 [Candidatus Jacksonbacteria bacterium RIFCSPLOWO2_01_FULL_44_13]OGY72812.1 MAG: 50S ribosomal protein L15 [Candidatus Jacksonbacteria bacterium RIFCSPLOWO2_02_FULL_43_9]HAZ16402.1 50S ribosomal protein L15 [Candidatus Jacksonbacteria bacterium]